MPAEIPRRTGRYGIKFYKSATCLCWWC